jgi:hypothetical protein
MQGGPRHIIGQRPKVKVQEVAEAISPCEKVQEVAETITTPIEIQEVTETITTSIEIQEVAETIVAPLVRPASTLRSSLKALKNSVFSFDSNLMKEAYIPEHFLDTHIWVEDYSFFTKFNPKLRFAETIELTTLGNFVISR